MSKYAKITQAAHYVPELTVTNDDLAKIMDTSNEWIVQRTGIHKRHISNGENTSDFCTNVAKQLLEKSGLSAEDLDFIIVATVTPDYATPSVSNLVQANIGATNAFTFDIVAACSGFVYALSTAEKFIRSGFNRGLVIGGESLSKITDWNDRASAILFGDAAGGVLLEASDEQHILGERLRSDGSRGLSLTVREHPPHSPFVEENLGNPYLKMTGRDIFDFATRDVPKTVQEVLEMANVTSDEVDWYLLHQANIRIIEKMAKKLNVSLDKFPSNIQEYGNTSAATIPTLLSEAVNRGDIVLGSKQKLMLTGFGGGLTWGSMLILS